MQLGEDEWLNRPFPADLLRHVEPAATCRKLRLFACHCCRRLGPLLGRDGLPAALAAAERFADGRASEEELRAGWGVVRKALGKAPLGTRWERALDAALHACSPAFALYDALHVSRDVAQAVEGDWADPGSSYAGFNVAHDPPRMHECAAQCALLRDLFSFHPVALSPAWLAWEGGQLRRLARGLYDEERFDDLPVLADALEEAGCDDPRLLGHARGPGPHFKGCWLLDAVAGLL